MAAKQDFTLRSGPKPGRQTQEGAFASSIRPDNNHHLPTRDIQAYIPEQQALPHAIGDMLHRQNHENLPVCWLRASCQTKTGAPMAAVTTPTGTSDGMAITRASVSATSNRAAPSNALAGSKIL